MTTTAHIDYAVITLPKVSVVEAAIPHFSAATAGGVRQVRSGYVGVQKHKTFLGYHDAASRWMFIRTGSAAIDIVDFVPERLDPYLSVARLDVQCTFPIDDADYFIRMLMPSSRYSARRLSPVSDRGETLYIGSPSSDLMARIYNKTVESGLPYDDGRELVRVEFVLRDRYADKAWERARAGDLDSVWVALARKMLTRDSASAVVKHAQAEPANDFVLFYQQDNDVVSRRLRWLESVVVPALNKLIALDPDSSHAVWRALDKIARPQ